MTDRLTALKGQIETEHKAFELTVRRGLAHIRVIGLYLSECHEAAKAEGVSFKKWIESEFAGKFTYQTAWNWMSVARNWDKFSEDDLAAMTMKEMLKAVADQNRWGGPPEDDTPAVGHPDSSETGEVVRPPLGLAAVPVSEGEEDRRGDAVGVLEYHRCQGHEVATGTNGTHTNGNDQESAVGIMPLSSAVAPPASSTTEDRVEAVARELGLPADTLRLALVKLGYLPAPRP